MPSKKAIQAVKDKVSAKTYRSTRNMEPEKLIQGINRTLAGWANYHRHGVSKAVFSAVDSHAWNRIMRWLRHKYKSGRSGIGCQNYAGASANPAPGGSLRRGQVHRRVRRAGHPLPIPRQQNPDPMGTPAGDRPS